ncbi:DNA-processing protein DprA [Ammonicoccus fulvus]|uniref:DNA-processing protein DprA n=1 Tax=Ammonicoccus fulvus TaxID=3138240 RepID=A0ABZ3FT13_9ACTN
MSGVAGLGVDERRARVVLSLLAEPDDATTGRLLQQRGAVETLRLLDSDAAVPGLSRVDAQVWRDRLSPQEVERLSERLRTVENGGFATLIAGDVEWPRALDDLGERAPYVLFVRGATSFLARPLEDLVTVTGSRASTSYGERVASELAGDLASRERLLVAGGAFGVEGAVHRGALAAGGDTIAVLAVGVDRLYPRGHRDLLNQVADVGALVSELPPGAVPTRHRFLARNRLLAALSGTTVIVEAAARSGALGVAREAHRLGRDVAAVPGPVTSVSSIGTHELLRAGTARLVASANDVEHLPPQHLQERAELSADFQRRNAPVSESPGRSM